MSNELQSRTGKSIFAAFESVFITEKLAGRSTRLEIESRNNIKRVRYFNATLTMSEYPELVFPYKRIYLTIMENDDMFHEATIQVLTSKRELKEKSEQLKKFNWKETLGKSVDSVVINIETPEQAFEAIDVFFGLED